MISLDNLIKSEKARSLIGAFSQFKYEARRLVKSCDSLLNSLF